MKTIKFRQNSTKYRLLAQRNKQIQYEAEYREVLAECDGDVETAKLVMDIKSIPGYDEGPPLVYEKPELKLIQ